MIYHFRDLAVIFCCASWIWNFVEGSAAESAIDCTKHLRYKFPDSFKSSEPAKIVCMAKHESKIDFTRFEWVPERPTTTGYTIVPSSIGKRKKNQRPVVELHLDLVGKFMPEDFYCRGFYNGNATCILPHPVKAWKRKLAEATKAETEPPKEDEEDDVELNLDPRSSTFRWAVEEETTVQFRPTTGLAAALYASSTLESVPRTDAPRGETPTSVADAWTIETQQSSSVTAAPSALNQEHGKTTASAPAGTESSSRPGFTNEYRTSKRQASPFPRSTVASMRPLSTRKSTVTTRLSSSTVATTLKAREKASSLEVRSESTLGSRGEMTTGSYPFFNGVTTGTFPSTIPAVIEGITEEPTANAVKIKCNIWLLKIFGAVNCEDVEPGLVIALYVFSGLVLLLLVVIFVTGIVTCCHCLRRRGDKAVVVTESTCQV